MKSDDLAWKAAEMYLPCNGGKCPLAGIPGREVEQQRCWREKSSATEFFEVFFDFESGHAAGTGGGDGLTIAAVLDVSAGEDSVDAFTEDGDEDVVFGLDVAVVVEVELAFEHGGVGLVADAEEHEGDGEGGALAGLAIEQLESFEIFFFDAEALLDDGVVEELDLGMGLGAFEHDAGGAEAFGAVDEGDFGGEAGEEESFFHGGVAAADDGDLFAGGEEAVAGGAGADAEADEGLLGGEAEPACGRTGGDDEGAGEDGVFAEGELEGRLGEIDAGEVGHAELGTEAGGLLLHVLDEFGTLDALGPAGEVFDEGGDGELTAGLVAFEDERLEVGAGGVDGGGEAGAAGAQDDGVANLVLIRHAVLIVMLGKGCNGSRRVDEGGLVGWRHG